EALRTHLGGELAGAARPVGDRAGVRAAGAVTPRRRAAACEAAGPLRAPRAAARWSTKACSALRRPELEEARREQLRVGAEGGVGAAGVARVGDRCGQEHGFALAAEAVEGVARGGAQGQLPGARGGVGGRR